MPVAIKDAFATSGMCTGWGTPVRASQMFSHDAVSVARLRNAGAVILGKTHLTEYCSGGAPPTVNPHGSGSWPRTPGGSSSGSAAAVAARMAPVATGTQTLGSVIRPAAFCGVYGFKPSFGAVSTDGACRVSAMLDHVGYFTRCASDLRLMHSVHTEQPLNKRPLTAGGMASLHQLRVAVPISRHWESASGDAIRAVWNAAAALESAGAYVTRVQLTAAFDAYHEHAQVRAYMDCVYMFVVALCCTANSSRL